MKKPLVSICCITYNHEKYIEDAINGFLMQKVDFPIEIIISDDKSTDKTREIIEKYAKKNPEIFKLFFHKKNLGAIPNFFDNINRATGKYIAVCEGDDYWTDPRKLQKQVDFMEKHPDYSVCFHPVEVIYEDGSKRDNYIYPSADGKKNWTLNELLRWNFIQTNSVMYRRLKAYDYSVKNITPGDWYMHIYHAKSGKIGFINETMSVYRRTGNGVFTKSLDNSARHYLEYLVDYLNFRSELMRIFDGSIKQIDIIIESNNDIIKDAVFYLHNNKTGRELLKQVFKKHPDLFAEYVLSTGKTIEGTIDLQNTYQKLESLSEKQRNIIKYNESEIKNLKQQINDIKYSRSFRLGKLFLAPLEIINRRNQ
jgi:glycosyltransferase involved in cell wall biosynthesis